jgi:signal transduction histidine kinase
VNLAEPAWTVAAIIATEPYTAGPRRIGFYTLAATALFVLVSGSLIFLLVRRVQGRTAELEAANLHLERENAVERIRAQVFSMQEANDLDQVVLALGREFQGLKIQFHNCGLQIVGQGGTHAERIALRANDQAVERGQASGWHEHISVYEAWHNQTGRLPRRPGKGQPLNPYGEDNLLKAGVRSVVDVPFRHGTLALSSELPNAFWPPDIEILQAFAAAIEGAYARHLDFQRLEESNLLIEQATRHKSDFLARMSHDLRTPMNAIIGYTRILLRRAKEKLGPRQFKNLENIESSAQNLLKLINGILDLSRIEAGHVGVSRKRWI